MEAKQRTSQATLTFERSIVFNKGKGAKVSRSCEKKMKKMVNLNKCI